MAVGVAEIRRLCVRPAFRGMTLGERLLGRLLADAGTFGYRSACLEAALFMTSARRRNEANGFADCPPYVGVEVPVGAPRAPTVSLVACNGIDRRTIADGS